MCHGLGAGWWAHSWEARPSTVNGLVYRLDFSYLAPFVRPVLDPEEKGVRLQEVACFRS